MKTIIFSLGGSLIVPENIDVDFLKKFKDFVVELTKNDYRVVIVTGGGKLCRTYNDAAKKMSSPSDTDLDWMGISATKINAELVRIIFGSHSYERVVKDPTKKIETDKRVIVASGFKPGNSSDKVAVILAINFGAKNVINMTNIEMVYDADPKKNPDAKPLSSLSWDKFLGIIGNSWEPGKNVPFDPVASTLAMENGVNVAILKGNNLQNIRAFLEGSEFVGTFIKSDYAKRE